MLMCSVKVLFVYEEIVYGGWFELGDTSRESRSINCNKFWLWKALQVCRVLQMGAFDEHVYLGAGL